MKRIIFIIIIACLFLAQAFASSTARMVEKGNKLYKDQKYDDALELYKQALSNQPDSEVINFNIGTAQYKTNDYQKASSSFEKSLITRNKSLETAANYDLGNSKYMLGLSKENTDLSGAVRLLEEALTNYKRTLELVSKNEDAKVNYEIVEKKLKELKEKLKKQPQENKNNQKQQEQNKEESLKQQEQNMQQARQQQEKDKQKEGKKQEEKKAADKEGQLNQKPDQQAQQQTQQQKQEEQKKQEQQAATGSPAQSGEQKRASARPEESKEISKEEANILLEGYRQEENAAGILKDDRKGVEENVLKDW